MSALKMSITFKDSEHVSAEAEDLDTLIEIMNQALYGLWGKSARRLKLMTFDEVDQMTGRSPNGDTVPPRRPS